MVSGGGGGGVDGGTILREGVKGRIRVWEKRMEGLKQEMMEGGKVRRWWWGLKGGWEGKEY